MEKWIESVTLLGTPQQPAMLPDLNNCRVAQYEGDIHIEFERGPNSEMKRYMIRMTAQAEVVPDSGRWTPVWIGSATINKKRFHIWAYERI